MLSDNMNENNPEIKKQRTGPLGFSGDQYWKDPLSNTGDIGEHRLFNHISGMLIDAPEKIYLDKFKNIPLVCLRTDDRKKMVNYSFNSTTYVFSVYLETGKIIISKLKEKRIRLTDQEPSPGFTCDWHVADLQKLLSLGTLPGKHNVMLLCGPEISNNQVVEIIPGSEKEDIDNYKKQIEQLNNESMPLPFKKAYTELKIKHHELTESDNEKKQIFEVSKTKENESDYRLTVDYSIAGLKRFLFAEELPKTPDGDDVFASLPVGIAVFNKDRVFVLFKELSLPVITKPEEKNCFLVFSGKVSFLLSSLLFDIVDAGVDLEELTIWFISMKHTAKVEIK